MSRRHPAKMAASRYHIMLIIFIGCFLYIWSKLDRHNTSIDRYLDTIAERQMHYDANLIPGVPYQYQDEVDLRFIVMVYNRPKSLSKCLNRLNETVLDRKVKARIEIWIDRSKKGEVHEMTFKVASRFVWKHGPVGVHVWPRHVGIYGQWIDSWRPWHGSKEIAIFLEDDIDVSPYIYQWVHAARDAYANRDDIGSIALNDENVQVSTGKSIGHSLSRPKTETTFLYLVLSTWGMAPIGASWRGFQDWYHAVTNNTTKIYHPYTPGATLQTQWYKQFEKQNHQDSMWSLWYIHYCYLHKLYALFPNLGFLKGKSLTRHRRAKGLHFSYNKELETEKYLMKEWKDAFVQFPLNPVKYAYNGSVIK